MIRSFTCLFFGIFLIQNIYPQTITIGSPIDQSLRYLQLAGKIDPNISFTARPFFTNKKITTDSIYRLVDNSVSIHYKSRISFNNDRVVIETLPVRWIQQYNSHHPYGWNDGSMIAAKGYQTVISGGVYAHWSILSIQFQPELVFAANPTFENFPTYGTPTSDSYKKIFAGQSSIRLNTNAISIGLSTENMWWGPGIYNSLLMSNNAPGFAHITFNTRRPLKTPIGSFEWQLIAGKLEEDNKLPYENFSLGSGPATYGIAAWDSTSHEWRYINALVIAYHPKWVPGLFVGMTREFYMYSNDLGLTPSNLIDTYLPVLNSFFKSNAVNEDAKKRDQITSLFLRWLFSKEQAEMYIEYGFNDHSYNIRDFVLGPTHSSAYLLGFRKLFPLRNHDNLEFGMELTQMAETPNYLVRDAGNWYIHGQILQGYTNLNQVIGAGVGGGNNLQTLTTTWIKGCRKIGILIERLEHDPVARTTKWTDISLGLSRQQNYKHFLFSTLLQFINSENYAWQPNTNRFNFHGTLEINYRW